MPVDRFCSQCGALVPSAADACPQCGFAEPRRNPVLDTLPAGRPGDRVTAAVADLAPVLALLGAALVVLIVGGMPGWLAPTLALAGVGWFAVLCGWEIADGTGPGKRWRSLAVMDDLTGDRPSPVGAVVRQLVRLVSVIGTLGFAGLSYRWDPAGRERTWWDRAAGARVVDATLAASVADGAGYQDWPQPAMGGWTPAVSSTMQQAGPPGLGPAAPRTPPTSMPAAGRPVDHRAGPPMGVVAAGTVDPDATTVIGAETMAEQRIADGSDERTVRADAPTTGVDESSVGADEPTVGGDEPTVRAEDITSQAAAPDPRAASDESAGSDQTAVGQPVWQTPVDPDEAATKTRVVARRELMAATRPVTATLEWDSGARLVAGGAVLIGREPVPSDGEQVDRRLAVGTDSMGVSKTHLLLSITTTGITVVDRFSTNGVRVERVDGSVEACPPGEPVVVHEGDTVMFGGRWIVVAPTSGTGTGVTESAGITEIPDVTEG